MKVIITRFEFGPNTDLAEYQFKRGNKLLYFTTKVNNKNNVKRMLIELGHSIEERTEKT